MHRSRIPILTKSSSSPEKGFSRWKATSSAKRKSPRSSTIRLVLFLCLGIFCGVISFLSFSSLYRNNQWSPKQPEKMDSSVDMTLPELPKQMYRQTERSHDLPPPPPIQSQFLIFKGFMKGQGTGNYMNGLLATHLLALEFNRTVCVSPDYKDFHLAFRPRQTELRDICASIIQQYDQNKDLRIMLNNFGNAPNECQLQKQLADPHQPVFVLLANTYPRWPTVPNQFFFTHYEPTPELLAMLPYETSPHTVVHLRKPDKKGADDRRGLDRETFQQLDQMLPADTFLVTNNVAWYQHFPTWQHPSWTIVKHTATSKYWGDVPEETNAEQRRAVNHALQVLQMWADWFTILSAQRVLHTASDFSHSAIHWQNIPAQIINGMQDGILDLVPESWVRDGETPRLLDRRLNAPEKADLRRCESNEKGQWDWCFLKGKKWSLQKCTLGDITCSNRNELEREQKVICKSTLENR